MELKPGYKQTEVGVIPVDWDSTTVRDIASPIRNAIVGGPFGSDLVSNDYAEDGVPVIRGQNMGWRYVSGPFAFVSPSKASSLEANLAHPGDLIFTQRGTLGQVSLLPNLPHDRYLVSQSQMKLTANRQFADPLFFYYVFSSSEQQGFIRRNTIQTGVPHINLGILRAIPVQRPPLDEQKAIGEMLSDADALIESLEQLLAKKRQLKQASMQELLTGKKRMPGFEKNPGYKQTEVGVIPVDWELTPLAQLSAFITKGSTPTTYGFRWEQTGVRFLRSECVSERGLDLIQSMYISEAANALLRRSEVFDGDILMTITGNVGRVVLLSGVGRGNVNQHIARVRITSSKADSRFVSYVLSQPSSRRRLASITTGQAYPQISLRQVREAEVTLPPTKAEQEAIAEALSDMDAEVAALDAKLTKARSIKQGMMQELLTGRIRLL